MRFTSLENALRLLDLLSVDEPELGIYEMAERLGIADSTAHRLATTLMSEGFITQDPNTKLYRLGASVLALGHVVTGQSKLYTASKAALQLLVNQSNETAHIGVLREFDVVYLNKIECSHPIRLLSHLGKRNPVHCTSSGQVLLAHQPSSYINAFLQRGLEQYTSRTITDPAALLKRLERIKEQGFSFCEEEMHEGASSLSAPVRNRKGQVTACVTLAGPMQRINQYTASKLVKLIIQTANEISKQLDCAGC